MTDAELSATADALAYTIQWIVGEEAPDPESLQAPGQRAIVMLWLLDPSAFAGFQGPYSLEALARGLHCSPDELRRTADEIERQFGASLGGHPQRLGNL